MVNFSIKRYQRVYSKDLSAHVVERGFALNEIPIGMLTTHKDIDWGGAYEGNSQISLRCIT